VNPKLARILAAIVVPIVVLVAPAAASAALDPDPVAYDWGNIDRYQQSPQQNFKFTNNEGGGVIAQASLSGTDAGQFVLVNDGCSGQFLSDGSSCNVSVYVSPQGTGPLSASLDVDDGNGVASVPLAATAVTGTLSVNPDPIAFNPQPWFYGSQNFNVNLQAQNYGVAISDVQITGPDQALFSINYGNCAGSTLQAWNGCSVGVGFNPTGPTGAASANLVITSNGTGSPQSIPMTAEALSGPDEQITPANKDFGAVALGSASATQTFTIKNLGDFPDQIQQVFTVAGSPQSFPVSNDGCTMHVVMPDDSCTFDVSFTPVSAGAKEASIFVISSGPSPVTQVGLSGRGYAEPGVAAVLNGNPEVGKTLECDPINAEGDLAYRWIRDGAPIAGAAKQTYELDDADFGTRISCRITASNPVGSASADSPQSAPVAARNLERQPHSLVDDWSCRLIGIDPIAGVAVSGTTPATPDSPLTFHAKKRLRVDLAGIERSGKRVRFTPRRLSTLDDGPVALSVDGRPVDAVLAPCTLSGRVTGSRGGGTLYALSGQTAMKSGSLRTPKLTIRPRRHETAQVSVYAYDRPTVQFPLDGRKAVYNGIRVKVSRHEVEFRGLPPGTSAVEVRFARGVVRGKGGEAKARASLQGTRNARATFSAAWR